MKRPLSPVEHVNWLIDQVIPQNFVMVAGISGQLAGDFLRRSLDIIQDKYALLKCKVIGLEGPEFVSGDVPGIPLRIIDRKDENHWLEETEKEIHEPFPWAKGPLMRVVLLTSMDKCDLLLTFCHIASDATSGVAIANDLLCTLSRLSSGEDIAFKTALSLSPSSLDLLKKDLKFKPKFLDFPGHAWRTLYKIKELQGDGETLPEKRMTRIIQDIISEDETNRLINRCKAKKTSVHGVLCAALMQAVVEEIRFSGEGKRGPLMISCVTPVNIRKYFIRPIGEDIGYYISHALHSQLIDDRSSLWIAANRVKKSLQRELDFGRDIKGLLSDGDLMTRYSSPLELVRGLNETYPPLAVTNMGRVDIPQQFGNLKLEKFHFAVSINPSVKNGFALAVTNFNGLTILNFLYAEPYLLKQRAVKLVENTMKRLKAAVK